MHQFYQYNNGSGWKSFYSGSTAKTVNFVPQSYGGTYGTVFRIRALIQNGWGQKTTGAEASFSCVSKAGVPGNFRASPSPMGRRDTVTLAWSAPSAGSGSLAGYSLAVQYNGGGWISLGKISGTSYSTAPHTYAGISLRSGGVLRFRVQAKNSYGVLSDPAYVSVTVRGGSFFFKRGGSWDDKGTLYIKVNGSWRETDNICIKISGSWRQP